MPTVRRYRGPVAEHAFFIVAGFAIAVIAAIVLAVVLLGGGSSGPSNNGSRPPTVKIDAGNSYGSGVIIDAKKGLILTNAHVGDDHAPGLAVQYPNEFDDFDSTPTELQILVAPGLDRAAEPRSAVVVASDGYLDIAVLKITKTAAGAFVSPSDLKGLKEVKLGSSSSVKSGDNIRIIGYPASSASRNPTITTGIIRARCKTNA